MTYQTPPTRNDPIANPAGDGEIIPETRAKQGRKGYQMLTVLIVSLALIVVAFGAIFASHTHTANDQTPAARQADTRTMARGSST